MRGWLVFAVVAVVAVAAVQFVDLATRSSKTDGDNDIAELRASVESLAAEVRELRGVLEAKEAGNAVAVQGPQEVGEQREDEERTLINVYADGTYAIDGEPCGTDELSEALDTLAESHPSREVVIVASDASYDAVVALMEECEKRGLKIAGAAGSSELGGEEAAESEAGPAEVNLEPVDVLLEIDAARKLTLDGREVARDALKAELKGLLQANPAMRLVVRAHESVPMPEVQEVLGIVSEAGIYRVDAGTTGGDEAPDVSE